LAALPSPALANGRFPQAGQLVVDPNDAQHIVVRTTFGLVQSFDAGMKWSWICEQAASPDGFQDPEMIVTTAGRIAIGLPDGLAIGDRSGCEWTRVPGLANDDVIDLVQSRADPATAYAAAAVTVDGSFNGLVARTIDGVAWSVAGALLPNTYPLTIEIAPSRPERLYLGADDGDLETGLIDVSDDGGGSWTVHSSPDGVDSVYVSAVDPVDPDRVYVRSFFPQNSLYVSEDAAATWTLIHASDVALTGFALAPDGRHIAVGGADGLTIITRTDSSAGSSFAVTATHSMPVSCLTWVAGGLFACSDEATAGFTIGVSIDGGEGFVPLLRLEDLTPACLAGASASLCAAAWCSTATAIGASCAVTGDAAADAAGDGGGVTATAGVGCACDASGARSLLGPAVALMTMLIAAWVSRQPGSERKLSTDSNRSQTQDSDIAGVSLDRGNDSSS
jgi:hypothetical protein